MTVFTKNSILDVWNGSEYVSGLPKLFCCGSKRDTQERWYMLNWLQYYWLTYPFWATCPWFLQVRLLIAVFSAFFHTGQSIFASMFHAFKSSVTVALHVLKGLPLPLKPSISMWMHLFIHLSLISTCPYHLRQFNLSFDFKGARFNHPYIVDRLTLSSAFIFSIQHKFARSLHRRCYISSLRRGQYSLA